MGSKTDFSGLSTRVLTAVVGGAALICLLIFGGIWGARLLAWMISFGMVYEFSRITFQLSDRQEKRLLLLLLTCFLSVWAAFWPEESAYLLNGVFLLVFGYFLLTAKRHPGTDLLIHTQELMFSVFGLVYLSFLPLSLPLLREMGNGLHYVLLFFLMNWVGDSFAFFIGKGFGRHKLSPRISPKKTLEGAAGGLVGSWIVAAIYWQAALPEWSLLGISLMVILVAGASQVGDLCESLIKRAFNRKDSGSILPGHGGFMDRFDGVVFSLPVMVLCVRFIRPGF